MKRPPQLGQPLVPNSVLVSGHSVVLGNSGWTPRPKPGLPGPHPAVAAHAEGCFPKDVLVGPGCCPLSCGHPFSRHMRPRLRAPLLRPAPSENKAKQQELGVGALGPLGRRTVERGPLEKACLSPALLVGLQDDACCSGRSPLEGGGRCCFCLLVAREETVRCECPWEVTKMVSVSCICRPVCGQLLSLQEQAHTPSFKVRY